MCRLAAALLLACALGFQLWAQTPPAQPPASQTSAAEPTPAGKTGSPSESSQFPLDQFQEFSAIMTGGPLPMSEWDGHIYRSGRLMRLQRDTAVPSYFISDLAKQETHGLAATGCMKLNYLYSRTFPFFLSGRDNKYERAPVGEETVDGHLCSVEDITVYAPKHPPIKLRFWEAKDLQGFPVQIEIRRTARIRQTIHYRNVVLGPQDPTLFIVPNKCQSSIGQEAPKKRASPTPQPKKSPAGKPQ